MKKLYYPMILVLFLGLHLFSLDILAQSCSQLGLPENALARLCRADDSGAPAIYTDAPEIFSASNIQQWLSEARKVDSTDPTFQRGLLMLEQLLIASSPEETNLLPNYPNPFNPETWIPYQLATDTNVQILIYDPRGILVRRLELGYQPRGHYTGRSRAAYWDGRNSLGEPVASGIYFYQLHADEVSLMRKMVILK